MYKKCLALLKEYCETDINDQEIFADLISKKEKMAEDMVFEYGKHLDAFRSEHLYSETFLKLEQWLSDDKNTQRPIVVDNIMDEGKVLKALKEILSNGYTPPEDEPVIFVDHLICFYLFYSYFSKELSSIPLDLSFRVDFAFTQAAALYGRNIGLFWMKGHRDQDRVYKSKQESENQRNARKQDVIEAFYSVSNREKKSKNRIYKDIKEACAGKPYFSAHGPGITTIIVYLKEENLI